MTHRTFTALTALLLVAGTLRVAAAPIRSVQVTGQLTAGGAAGSYLNVTCTPRGSVLNGSGSLYGQNPQTGYRYNYPIVITGSRTSSGFLTLTGTLSGYPLTITAAVPSGRLTVSYVVNRTTITSTGQGTVVTR